MKEKRNILINALKIIILFIAIIFLCMPKGFATINTEDIEQNYMKKYCKSPKVDKNGQPEKWDENTTVTIKKNEIPKDQKKKEQLLKEINSRLTQFQSNADKKMIHYKFLQALKTAITESDDSTYDSNKIKEMEGWDYEKIKEYLQDATNNTKNIQGSEFSTMREKWKEKIEKEETNEAMQEYLKNRLEGGTIEEAENAAKEYNPPSGKYIYKNPKLKGNTTGKMALDDMIGDADSFISVGNNSEKIKQTELQDMASSIFSIVLQIGVAVATIVGLVLGIKFMMSGADGKAEVKKMLITYIIGCTVVFGAFAFWKIVVLIIRNL